MFVVKGILLVLSFLGYGWLFYDRIHIKKHFVPITVLSWLSVVLFLLGLAGQLRTGAYGIYLLGFLLLGYAGWRLKKGKWNPKFPINMVDICFVGVAAIFLVLSFFLKMDHYDNFSHWAVIVKNLVATDQYPGLQDSIISFKDYPLGISVYLYYFARLWGYGQGILLFAQNLFLLAGFYAIFGIVREKRRFLVYAFLMMGFSLVSYLNLTIRINNLLVDFHLPILALAAISIIDSNRNERLRMLCSLLPLLGILTVMKNTGMIFVGFSVLYLLLLLLQKKMPGKQWISLFLAVGFMFLMNGAWSFHMEHNLPEFEQKFSAEAVSEEYLPVVKEQHQEVISLFLKETFSLSSRAATVYYVTNVAALLLCAWFLITKKELLRMFWVLLGLNILLAGYYLGILYMYLYLMPAEEALRLAGFERYACSIMTFFAGGMILAGIKEIEEHFYYKNAQGDLSRAFYSPKTKMRYQTAVLAAVLVGFNFLYSELNGLVSIRKEYDTSIAGRVEHLVGDHWYQTGEDDNRYLVIANDEESKISSHQLRYTMRYFLYASDVRVTPALEWAELSDTLKDYDKVIFFDDDVLDGYGKNKAVLQQKKIWDAEELGRVMSEKESNQKRGNEK